MKIDAENLDKDPLNITFLPRISDVYDRSGNVLLFRKQKYAPIVDFVLHFFKKIKCINLKDLKLLDVGIGYGAFLKVCEERGFINLYGMDPFPQSVDIARNYTSAELRIGTIESLPWPFGEQFKAEVITCLDVIEHLQYPKVFFKNARKYLADEGIIVVRTPNKEFPYSLRKLPLIGDKDDNPTHINVHNWRYWRVLVQKTGFEIIKDWKGEHLGHIKHIDRVEKFCDNRGIDHRKVPLLNEFERGYVMVIKSQK